MVRFFQRWPYEKIQKIKHTGVLTLVILFAIVLIQFTFSLEEPESVPAMGGKEQEINNPNFVLGEVCFLLGVDIHTYKKILAQGMPLLAYDSAQSGRGFLETAMFTVLNINLRDPKSFFGSGMSVLGAAEVMAAAPRESHPPPYEDEADVDIPQFTEEELEETEQGPLFGEQNETLVGTQVLIYNTHNAETYAPTDGTSKLEGQNAGVVKVAVRLETVLNNQYRIQTASSKTIHDYPQFEKSYGNSEATLKSMLNEHSGAKIVIDVHRDAGLTKAQTVTVDGKKCAKIRLIVGSDARLSHFSWTKNREFAKQVTQKMDQMFPGLSLGYRVQSGRYNQHLHPNAILIEVGSDLNTLQEALNAADLFAAVINELLKPN